MLRNIGLRVSSSRLRRLSVALLIALTSGLILRLLIFGSPGGLILRGDFPAFYAAASLVASGEGEALYEASMQARVQQQAWPELESEYLAFAYPPYFALFLSPLAALEPLVAKILWTTLMVFCAVISLFMALRLSRLSKRDYLPLVAFTLTFPPFFSGLLAGQNTALSLLLISIILYLQRAPADANSYLGKEQRRRDYLSGILLGLWFFKPHFALVAVLLFFLAGRFRVLAAAAVTAAVLYLLGAYVAGWLWPFVWTKAALEFSSSDALANAHQMISIWGLQDALVGLGISSFAILPFSIVLTAYLCFLIARRVYPAAQEKDHEGQLKFYSALLLLGPLVVLVSPHVLYYEFGMVLLPFLCLSERWQSKNLLFLFAWVTSLVLLLPKEEFYLQPLFFLALLAFFTLLGLLKNTFATASVPFRL